MTTDASPVNRYLLFDRADDFRTNDKIAYALRAGRVLERGKESGAAAASPPWHGSDGTASATATADAAFTHLHRDLQKRFLVRTLDEVKRRFACVERQPPPPPLTVTPSTDATGFTYPQSVYSSPEMIHSPTFNATEDVDRPPDFLEDNEELDAKPWDNVGAQATYWNWPIETLYQRYHVVQAIDFGKSAFSVSGNGEVFADRIPGIVSALLHVIETTLRAREKSVGAIKAWLSANVQDEDTRQRVLSQVWDPTIYVSIMLINAPKPLETAVPLALARSRAGRGVRQRGGGRAVPSGTLPVAGADADRIGGDGGGVDEVPFLPPSHTPFSASEAGGEGGAPFACIPIVAHVDARRLVHDPTVVPRLRDTLLAYENACRQRAKDSWPESSLSTSLEYLIRSAPESAAECHSVILVSNIPSAFCPSTLAFLESVVRRKNLIVSVVALSRLFAIDSASFSPLAQFLSSVGGFAVHLDYWLSLSTTRLNSEWCQRFEGARCLAQQIFVHLVNRFPVASFGIAQRHAVLAGHADRMVLYNSEKGLPDFVLGSSLSTLSLLRAVSAARFNEGWCVLLDYKDESTAAHLVSRVQYCFHRGALVLHYEMDINRPAVYRRLLVSGTRALADHFCRLHVDDLEVSTLGEAVGSWFTHLALLRLRVRSWMRAEQTMLELLSLGPRTTSMPADLGSLTSFSGVMAEWLNASNVSSVGLFFQREKVFADGTRALVSHTAAVATAAAGAGAGAGAGAVALPSVMTAAEKLIRQTMLRQHRPIGREEELTFVRAEESGANRFLYVVQYFPLQWGGAGGAREVEEGMAAGFECRVSFFLCDREVQHRLLVGLVDSLRAAVGSEAAELFGGRPESPKEAKLAAHTAGPTAPLGPPRSTNRLRLSASTSLVNGQALLVVLSAMSARRMELLSYCTERLGAHLSGTGRHQGGQLPQQQAPLGMRPPLAKGKTGGPASSPMHTASWRLSAALQLTMRAPFVVFPWSLANSRLLKWVFTGEESFDSFADDAFRLLLMRRVHTASDVLVCFNSTRRAVLLKQLTLLSGAQVNVFDVIEGSANNGPTSSSSTTASSAAASSARSGGAEVSFSVLRLITPYTHAQGSGPGSAHALIEDIAEDGHLITALSSYRAFSRHPSGAGGGGAAGNGGGVNGGSHVSGGGGAGGGSSHGAERRTVFLAQQRALGATVLKTRIDSLLPYLQAERMEVVSLRSPRTLGSSGCASLRAKAAHLVASMGDRHVWAPCGAFNRGVLRALRVLRSRDSDAHNGDDDDDDDEGLVCADNCRILVSLLYPIRYHTITFILMAEKNSEDDLAACVVSTGIAFLDAALLEYGLMRKYGGPSSTSLKMPNWTFDSAVVSSVKHMLTSFASVFTARQLIRLLSASEEGASSQGQTQEQPLAELGPLLAGLETYATEMDITYLLRAIEARHGGTRGGTCLGDAAPVVRKAVQEVIATLALRDAMSFRSLPAVFFPAVGTAKTEGPAWLSAALRGAHVAASLSSEAAVFRSTLPVAFACCVSFEHRQAESAAAVGGGGGGGGGEAASATMDYHWVSSASREEQSLVFPEPDAATSSSTPPLLDHLADEPPAFALAAAPTRMVLRVFVKTVPRELLDLCTDPDYRPPSRVVRSALHYLLFRYKPAEPAESGANGPAAEAPKGSGNGRSGKGDGPSTSGLADRLGGGGGGGDGDGVAAEPTTLGEGGPTDDGFACGRTLDQLWRSCLDFASFPDPVEQAVRAMVVDPLVVKLAAFALCSTFHSASFRALRRSVLDAGAATVPAVPANGSGTGSSTPKVLSPSGGKDGEMAQLFAQPSLAVCRAAAAVAGLPSSLRDIVAPALRSSPVFQLAVFPVEFTQQATTYRSVDPTEAALDVFRRCVEEDHICVVAAGKECSYAFVPNAAFFGRRWLVVQVDIQPSLLLNKASIFFFDAECSEQQGRDRRTPAAVSKLLRTHIYTKITQISQLHLLKQLRDSQYANTELVPLNWGKQFSNLSGRTANSRGSVAGLGGNTAYARHAEGVNNPTTRGREAEKGCVGGAHSLSPNPSTNFYLRGTDVLRIPIYYKLQQYGHKILQFISNNSARLELFQVYNREQCFVVADDEEGDIFHYIRLVFVKDLGQEVSPTQPSPPLSQTDRCPEMIVQLFTATSNASIRRPLRKLQDFCYFLAVQELQGHLNYVNSISFNDLVFLQNQPLTPIVIDVASTVGGAATKDDVQLALSLLFLNLRGNKFKLLDFQDGEQSHTKSVFVKHYILDEEAKSRRSSMGRGDDHDPPPQQPQPHQPPRKQSESHGQTQSVPPEGDLGRGGARDVGAQGERASSGRQRTMRFVKVVDGSTDVLCSCALRWCEDAGEAGEEPILYLDRYLTKLPSERYINGESERVIMKQLSDLVKDTEAQLAFHAVSRSQAVPSLPMDSLPHCAERLLSIAETVTSAESSLLCFRALSTDDVSPAVLPYLVERVCGAVRLFSPRCCEGTADEPRAFQELRAFSWSWVERQQKDPTSDQKVVYILCGYEVSSVHPDEGGATAQHSAPSSSSSSSVRLLSGTHVLPYSLPELSLTATTMEEHQMGVLREQNLSPNGPVMALRIVVKLSLTDGLCVGVFNMRDADYLLRLLASIVCEMEEKSRLLQDILMQRLGFAVPSAFNEADLARNCCGDATNVLQGKTLTITGDTYRRRVNTARFRPRIGPTADDLTTVIEGLYNRGLIVNYVFPIEDAIAVLFNECEHYSLGDCERIVERWMQKGVLVRDEGSALRAQVPLLRIAHGKGGSASQPQAFNCRVAEVSGVPADALIACSYHRHVLATHVIVEAQNARSEVDEVLSECDLLWRAGPQENVLGLAKATVTLQMKSKQVFGSRVPDFSLRREGRISEDDVLEESLPPHVSGRGPSLSTAVDAAMRLYMHHLRRLYPTMCIIDLDPADPLTTKEAVLLNRLKCRYGKVTTESGSVMRFGVHLYYAVIPFIDVLRCKSMQERYGHVLPTLLPQPEDSPPTAASPITGSGLFVVEVGFQVVNYALDFFAVSGSSVPLSVAAKVAADFKQSLAFDGVLYDAFLQHLQERLRSPAADLIGYVDVVTTLCNFVKYYPSPPANCVHIADVFSITDPRVMRLRSLPQSRRADGTANTGVQAGTDGGGGGGGKRGSFLVLAPDKDVEEASLLRPRTGEGYRYCGLISWATAQLFVLLCTERDPSHCARVASDDLPGMVLQAKRLLLAQLLASTQQERFDAAWHKFLYDGTRSVSLSDRKAAAAGLQRALLSRRPASLALPKDLPSYDEFELLRSHCQRVVLQSYRSLLQAAVGDLEWTGDASALERAAQGLFPECVLRLLWKPSRSAHGSDTAVANANGSAVKATVPDSPILNEKGAGGSPPPPPPLLTGSAVAAAGLLPPPTVGGYDVAHLFASSGVAGRVIITFAHNAASSRSLLGLECWSTPGCDPPFIVEDVSVYRRPDSTHPQLSLVAVLTAEEETLIQKLLLLMSNMVFATILPCSSQVMV